MQDQHKLIKGYRDLSKEEIGKMNELKEAGNKVGEILEELSQFPGLDYHFITEGKFQIQIGLMLAVRGIAQPTTFC